MGVRVLMFQERFVAGIRSGEKRQTIRKKARCKPGDVLSLRRWTGRPYRSKQEEIRRAVCTGVSIVGIVGPAPGAKVRLSVPLDEFARRDGFRDWADMRAWFEREHGLPFVGRLIRW